MRNILLLSLFTLLACTLGCGGDGYTVGGKVTFPDGTAVPRGQVTFYSATFTGGGAIAADGLYTINTRVPAGTYQVTVRASGESPSDPTADITEARPAPPPLVDPKFGNPETSELVFEVKRAATFNIEVTPPQ